MPRNLDNRIELACPVKDPEIRKELMDMIQIQIRDNCKARLLGADNFNEYIKPDGEERVRSQFEIYDYLKAKLD